MVMGAGHRQRFLGPANTGQKTHGRVSRPFGRIWSAVAAVFLGAVAAFTPTVASAQGGVTIARDSEIEDILRQYSEPLFKAAGVDPSAVRIILVQDKSLNAFVSGGQNMFINTGLIMASKNANELKGVIAHETGHIAGGHLARTRDAIRSAQAPALVTIGLGILAIAAGAPDAGMAIISGSSQMAMGAFVEYFSRAQESSADQAAITFLDATGQSGRGLLEFADRQFRYNEILLANRIPPWMRTHPLWEDRIQALRQRVTQSPFYNAPEPPEDAASFAVMQAKLTGYLEAPAVTFRRYPSTDQSVPARYARTIAMMRDSRLPQALVDARALLADQPDNPFFMELVGEIALDVGDARTAQTHYRQALEKRPNDALMRVSLARALLAPTTNEGVREAIDLLQQTNVIDPNNTTAWHLLGQAHYRLGEEPQAQLASAELHYVIGNYPGAISFAQRAAEKLTRGTPAAVRASDILTLSRAAIQGGAMRGRR